MTKGIVFYIWEKFALPCNAGEGARAPSETGPPSSELNFKPHSK
jgi:hypothetical protein